jgi:hypothetical protein
MMIGEPPAFLTSVMHESDTGNDLCQNVLLIKDRVASGTTVEEPRRWRDLNGSYPGTVALGDLGRLCLLGGWNCRRNCHEGSKLCVGRGGYFGGDSLTQRGRAVPVYARGGISAQQLTYAFGATRLCAGFKTPSRPSIIRRNDLLSSSNVPRNPAHSSQA